MVAAGTEGQAEGFRATKEGEMNSHGWDVSFDVLHARVTTLDRSSDPTVQIAAIFGKGFPR